MTKIQSVDIDSSVPERDGLYVARQYLRQAHPKKPWT